MKISLYTAILNNEIGIRELLYFKRIELDFVPPIGSSFYDKDSTLSYKINEIFFTETEISIIVFPYQPSRVEPIEKLFPKKQMLI